MTDATFTVTHVVPLGQLPEHWHEYWRHVLSYPASMVYPALSDERLAGTEVSLAAITKYLGMSKFAFGNALKELEAHDLLWLDTEERPPGVNVHAVPEPGPNAVPPKKRDVPATPWRTIWEFINHWCELHERNVEEPYPRPRRGKGRDTVLMDEMLRTYSVETLKHVATWFFKHRKADEPSTLAYFNFHLPRLVSAWKDEGGTPLPKMKEEPTDEE